MISIFTVKPIHGLYHVDDPASRLLVDFLERTAAVGEFLVAKGEVLVFWKPFAVALQQTRFDGGRFGFHCGRFRSSSKRRPAQGLERCCPPIFQYG